MENMCLLGDCMKDQDETLAKVAYNDDIPSLLPWFLSFRLMQVNIVDVIRSMV
jgi:hypothetical protein